MEKYVIFPVQIKLIYKLQFIYSVTFMTSLLLNFLKNLAEGIHKIKCKPWNVNVKDNFTMHKYFCCYRNYQKKFDEDLRSQSTLKNWKF